MKLLFFCFLIMPLASVFAQDEIFLRSTGRPIDFELKILKVQNDTLSYKVFRKIKHLPLSEVLSYFVMKEEKLQGRKFKTRILYKVKKDSIDSNSWKTFACRPYLVLNNDSIVYVFNIKDGDFVVRQHLVSVITESGEEKHYKPFEIKGYRKDCDYYESKYIIGSLTEHALFAEELVEGPATLHSYYVFIIPFVVCRYIIEKPDKSVIYTDEDYALLHKKKIKEIFDDIPGLFDDETASTDFRKLVAKYNAYWKKMKLPKSN